MKNPSRLTAAFYTRDVLDVAPGLCGKILARQMPDGEIVRHRILETEAYRGSEDQACHARHGRTKRTEVMYHSGGAAYLYLIYGLHWMLNIVTGREGDPQAVLIRVLDGALTGPGKLTHALNIDGSFNGEDLTKSLRLWIEDDGYSPNITTAPRVGIDYAAEPWRMMPWRFIADTKGEGNL